MSAIKKENNGYPIIDRDKEDAKSPSSLFLAATEATIAAAGATMTTASLLETFMKTERCVPIYIDVTIPQAGVKASKSDLRSDLVTISRRERDDGGERRQTKHPGGNRGSSPGRGGGVRGSAQCSLSNRERVELSSDSKATDQCNDGQSSSSRKGAGLDGQGKINASSSAFEKTPGRDTATRGEDALAAESRWRWQWDTAEERLGDCIVWSNQKLESGQSGEQRGRDRMSKPKTSSGKHPWRSQQWMMSSTEEEEEEEEDDSCLPFKKRRRHRDYKDETGFDECGPGKFNNPTSRADEDDHDDHDDDDDDDDDDEAHHDYSDDGMKKEEDQTNVDEAKDRIARTLLAAAIASTLWEHRKYDEKDEEYLESRSVRRTSNPSSHSWVRNNWLTEKLPVTLMLLLFIFFVGMATHPLPHVQCAAPVGIHFSHGYQDAHDHGPLDLDMPSPPNRAQDLSAKSEEDATAESIPLNNNSRGLKSMEFVLRGSGFRLPWSQCSCSPIQPPSFKDTFPEMDFPSVENIRTREYVTLEEQLKKHNQAGAIDGLYALTLEADQLWDAMRYELNELCKGNKSARVLETAMTDIKSVKTVITKADRHMSFINQRIEAGMIGLFLMTCVNMLLFVFACLQVERAVYSILHRARVRL